MLDGWGTGVNAVDWTLIQLAENRGDFARNLARAGLHDRTYPSEHTVLIAWGLDAPGGPVVPAPHAGGRDGALVHDAPRTPRGDLVWDIFF